ncbi:9575_t:CDS:1, partial [Paraglomus brasilianum]
PGRLLGEDRVTKTKEAGIIADVEIVGVVANEEECSLEVL